MVGLSCLRANGRGDLVQFVERQRLPVVLSPMAKGFISEQHPAYAGVLFHALSDVVAETIRDADLILAVGYDPVEFNYEDWLTDVPLVHVDTVPADVDASCHLAAEVVGDVGAALRFLAQMPPLPNVWEPSALEERRHRMFSTLTAPRATLSPSQVTSAVQELLPEDGWLTCDVGAHTHLIGQLWHASRPGQLIMTNGWSSMGFGIPAALAAKLCQPAKKGGVHHRGWGISDDGGRDGHRRASGLAVVVVVLVDRHLQLITVKQERQGYPCYGTPLFPAAYSSPSHYFGVPVLPAGTVTEVHEAIAEGLAASGPVIVEATVDPSEYDEIILRRHKLEK